MSFTKHIEHAGRKVGRSRAFCDFLTLAVCALSAKQKEDEYLQVAKKYSSDEMMHFSKAFACMVDDMNDRGGGLKDCLGDYFMDILSNERQGQFFSPQPICDLMAVITHSETENTNTVNDCCCGSGRMLLASAKINRFSKFYGADIDIQCCQMTLINLCLNGLFGVVSHMDTLRALEWRRWAVELHPLYLFPYIREIDLTIADEIKEIPKNKPLPPEPKHEIKPIQTTLDSLFASVDLLI